MNNDEIRSIFKIVENDKINKELSIIYKNVILFFFYIYICIFFFRKGLQRIETYWEQMKRKKETLA